jgi:hypothetical protein
MSGRYTAGELRRIDAWANWVMTRQDAEEVDCEGCGAEIGQHCTNPTTGDVLRAPAHPQRIKKAEQRKTTR